MAAKNLVESENSTSGAEQLIDYMMKSDKYGDYLKNLMAEVVEDKIGPRLDLEAIVRDRSTISW